MSTPALPPPSFDEVRDAWRAAVLAYRQVLRATNDDARTRGAALDAYLAARPGDDREAAKVQVVRAIAYAAAQHTAWFWRGAR